MDMARCTAPVRGHQSASAAANCPACGGRYGRHNSGYRSYSAPSYSPALRSGSGRSSGGGSSRSIKPRWSEQVRPCFTRLKKLGRSHPSVIMSKTWQSDLTFGTSSSAMRGTTGRGSPRNCTICLSHAVSPSGSARRTLASACRYFEQ